MTLDVERLLKACADVGLELFPIQGRAIARQYAIRSDAAKPTGSADEPLLRAALERIAAMGHTDEHKEWNSGPYCMECEDIDAAVVEARAALASAEPAEVDGGE